MGRNPEGDEIGHYPTGFKWGTGKYRDRGKQMRKEYIRLIEEARREGIPVSEYLRLHGPEGEMTSIQERVMKDLSIGRRSLLSTKTMTDEE